jgi:protein CpxP
MKFSNVFLIAALSVASLSSLSVIAKPGMSPERMLLSDRAKSFLSLTDAQQSQIKSIIEQQKSALEQYKEAGKETRQQTKALIHSETFDEQAFRDFFLSNQDSKLEISVIKARGKHQIWNILDEDQQEKLQKMMKYRKNKMRKKLSK